MLTACRWLLHCVHDPLRQTLRQVLTYCYAYSIVRLHGASIIKPSIDNDITACCPRQFSKVLHSPTVFNKQPVKLLYSWGILTSRAGQTDLVLGLRSEFVSIVSARKVTAYRSLCVAVCVTLVNIQTDIDSILIISLYEQLSQLS